MNTDERLKVLKLKNKKLFGFTHTMCIVLVIGFITLTLSIALPPSATAMLVGIAAFFILYHYAAYAVKKTNNRISLLETKYRDQDKSL
ncbi:hypothetical protein VINI7043_29160 [Vibrio nigripulchritudo ATCC 27043]|uniref:hypothetical protein n=1 Tax=Vibrio nigripulchritudo TaxID=28173 RepID=UPI00021C29D1|nr:hypothetical protein [Vibrio nigripulchritudo]EGU60376.1 hypothetical protein VINI7043_29160 [Vibrio nigripulchritudo ATCC 27043]